MNQRLTLVLLTQDQPDFLRRALKYYQDFACAIVVLDTSAQASDVATSAAGVGYVHRADLSDASLSTRIAAGIGQVTTPFVVCAEVSSFLLADGVSQSLQFLEANPAYGVAQGYSLSYQAHVNHVDYLRRDRKVLEDHAAPLPEQRLISVLGSSISLFNAVTRTELAQRWFASVPDDTEPHWQDIGQMSFMAAAARVRILAVAYALHLREDETRHTRYCAAIHAALSHRDPKATTARQNFAQVLLAALGDSAVLGKEQVLAALNAMAEDLETQAFQGKEVLFKAQWNVAFERSEPRFEPEQFVALPFYNQPLFDELARIEFLIHVLPAGRAQLAELEGALLRQAELTGTQLNPDAETFKSRLWQAYALYAFNLGVVRDLAVELGKSTDDEEEAKRLIAWGQRLEAVSSADNGKLLDQMPSGRLLNWLDSRDPAPFELKKQAARLAKQPGGSQIGILLLDLEADIFKLQATFDSLMNSHYKAFKVIVFTTGDLPAVTTLQNIVHFVKVTEANYVDRINQIVKQSGSDWLMLARAGEQFTRSGLFKASVELADAQHVRAVAVDEIHRHTDGTLTPLFRPGFNLDLLQSVPALMAPHWLIRRELLVEVGGYAREFDKALEFDVLLRLIEQGGMNGLAHFSEPVLVCDAPELEVNEAERKALVRHLGQRGYQAEVSSALPGTYKIDYRHATRPMVSILVLSQNNLADLQRCVQNVLQRTRYQRYEILIADNHSGSPEHLAWLDQQQQASSRIRVFKSDTRVSPSALRNLVSREAKGEYLILLDAESQVVNVGWIESLLNQAQRPEVGVVGVKLVDREGSVTQAGLILGFDGSVGSAFVGESKRSHGYMQRLVVEQNWSAVSGACLMIAKDLFNTVGGLDEGPFAEDLADVDLCLKTAQSGSLTVWTPHVQVVHSGLITASDAARQALADKWSGQFAQDEAYNVNLTRKSPGFTLISA
jgi:GT2 family glycosyltransferase